MYYANRKVINYNDYFTLGVKAYSKGRRYVYGDIITLDTETSANIVYDYDSKGNKSINKENSNAWLYQWAICTKDYIINGGDLDSLIITIDSIALMSQQAERKIYVHNLGYDATYIIQALIKKYGVPKVIALDKHKDISINFENNITLCCSYRLSNKSLDKWSKDLNTEHKKKVGFVDYSIKHYPNEERTDADNIYMWHDVVTQYECIDKTLNLYGDNIATIPLTSTGYVRRLVRKSYHDYNLANNDKAFKDFKKCAINEDIYNLLRLQFQGGLTHGNRFYANKTVKISKKLPYGRHRDFDSHYPTQQLTKKYPSGKWRLLYDRSECKADFTKAELEKIIAEGKAVLMLVSLKNLKLRNPSESLPYAQESKFRQSSSMYGVFDNGRLLEYHGESIVALNEIDYEIIKRQYTCKMIILKLYTTTKDYLPKWLTDVIKQLYKQKNNLKNKVKAIEKRIENGENIYNELYDAQLDLLKVKELLNAIYGMTATNPVRTSYELDANGDWIAKSDDVVESLTKYFKSRNNCLRYDTGCWCTSYARYELINKKDLIESNGGIFLYADTDSIFYLSNDDVERALEEDDKKRHQIAIDNGFSVELDDGTFKYFDKFDREPDFKEFRFLHAKCYGIIDMNDHLDITVAGVRKKECIGLDDNSEPIFITREDELKSLSNMVKGFKFSKCGGTSITYIPKPLEWREIDGRRIKCGNCAIIQNVDKTLSDFTLKEIIENVKTSRNSKIYL